jgi:hypothetical protein
MATIAGALGASALPGLAVGQDIPPSNGLSKGTILVTELGAKGDGKTDDTQSFRKALRAADNAGGAIVSIPAGRYRITRPLETPANVTLEGTHRSAPPVELGGSIILADVSPGPEDGQSFITLKKRSALSGLCITYPQQNDPENIKPFPWCVQGSDDNCSIVNCLLHNPYQGVDFGTLPSGRHFIDGLYGQPLKRGLYIDYCYDVGRVRNVHFWPFWDFKARAFMETQGTAFIIGRTDWEYMDFCFCIWYRVGFHFVSKKHGPGNVLAVNSGADLGPIAVQVDHVQGHSGVSFVNGQFMSGIEVSKDNTGPVKFTTSGFWGLNEKHMPKCSYHARLAGKGQITFDGCHFVMWDLDKKGAACIEADCQGVAVRNCDFVEPDKQQIRIGPKVKSAIITGNRLRGGTKIDAPKNDNFAIGMNSPA